MTMSQSINICFSRCSGDVLSFCSLAIKLFRGSLTVSETFFFKHPFISFPVRRNARWLYKSAPFCLSCSRLSKQMNLFCIRAWKLSCGKVSPFGEGKPEHCGSNAQWSQQPRTSAAITQPCTQREKSALEAQLYTQGSQSPPLTIKTSAFQIAASRLALGKLILSDAVKVLKTIHFPWASFTTGS